MRPLLPVALALLIAAPAVSRREAPPPDLGTIALDRQDPVIDATIAGLPARIAVALDARETIELAPSFSPRPDVVWQKDSHEEVGRVRVETRMAGADVAIGGVAEPRKVTTHDLPCCAGHDGEVSPLSLPWSVTRLGPAGGAEQRWPATFDDVSGLAIPIRLPGGDIRLILSLRRAESVATASAAAILAKTYGGHFTGEGRQVPIAFGIQRQVRDMMFDRPVPLLGFSVSRLAVRFADFAGGRKLPEEDAGGGIEVRKRGPSPQHEWATVTLGRDLLDRCPTITVYRDAPAIGLVCRPG